MVVARDQRPALAAACASAWCCSNCDAHRHLMAAPSPPEDHLIGALGHGAVKAPASIACSGVSWRQVVPIFARFSGFSAWAEPQALMQVTRALTVGPDCHLARARGRNAQPAGSAGPPFGVSDKESAWTLPPCAVRARNANPRLLRRWLAVTALAEISSVAPFLALCDGGFRGGHHGRLAEVDRLTDAPIGRAYRVGSQSVPRATWQRHTCAIPAPSAEMVSLVTSDYGTVAALWP